MDSPHATICNLRKMTKQRASAETRELQNIVRRATLIAPIAGFKRLQKHLECAAAGDRPRSSACESTARFAAVLALLERSYPTRGL